MAMFHDRLVVPAAEKATVTEALTAGGVFNPQLRILLRAAEEHLYGDGLNLSNRIWKIDRNAREGMNNVLMQGIANGDSALNIAKQLEQFLGANQDCPRWTSSRLYGQTKKQIAAGSDVGLLRGDQCDGKGVAYNALRLARTEIQKIHALATDRVLAMQPWVEQEQVHLSAAHPGTDECDDVVKGGEKSDGVYPVGTIELPIHPNCLCYKTAVLMAQGDFTKRLNSWLKGTEAWPEMNDYATTIGVDLTTSLANDPVTVSLAVWMFGEALEEWLQ
jgi:hypothetical protein